MEQKETNNPVTTDAAAQALADRGYTLRPFEREGETMISLYYGDLKVCITTDAIVARGYVQPIEKLPRPSNGQV